MKKKKKKKRVPQTNEIPFRNQDLQQKSHQKDKYLGSSSCKILETILDMDKRGTKGNGLEYKEADDYVQGLIPER